VGYAAVTLVSLRRFGESGFQVGDHLGEQAGVVVPDGLRTELVDPGDLRDALVGGACHGGKFGAGDRAGAGGGESGGAVYVLHRRHRAPGCCRRVAGTELVALAVAHIAGNEDPATAVAPGGIGRGPEAFQAVAAVGGDHAGDADGLAQPVAVLDADAGGDVGVAEFAAVVGAQPDEDVGDVGLGSGPAAGLAPW
jgi:hypothetical protein